MSVSWLSSELAADPPGCCAALTIATLTFSAAWQMAGPPTLFSFVDMMDASALPSNDDNADGDEAELAGGDAFAEPVVAAAVGAAAPLGLAAVSVPLPVLELLQPASSIVAAANGIAAPMASLRIVPLLMSPY